MHTSYALETWMFVLTSLAILTIIASVSFWPETSPHSVNDQMHFKLSLVLTNNPRSFPLLSASNSSNLSRCRLSSYYFTLSIAVQVRKDYRLQKLDAP